MSRMKSDRIQVTYLVHSTESVNLPVLATEVSMKQQHVKVGLGMYSTALSSVSSLSHNSIERPHFPIEYLVSRRRSFAIPLFRLVG